MAQVSYIHNPGPVETVELDQKFLAIIEEASRMPIDFDWIQQMADRIEGSASLGRGFDKAAILATLNAKKLSPTAICTLVAQATAMYCILGTGKSAFMNESSDGKQFVQNLLEAGVVPTGLRTARSDKLTIPQLMACLPTITFRAISGFIPRMRHEGVPIEWRGICSPLTPLLMRFLNDDHPALAATIKSHYLANQQAIASRGRSTVSAEQIFNTMARTTLSESEEKAALNYLKIVLLYSKDLHNPNEMIIRIRNVRAINIADLKLEIGTIVALPPRAAGGQRYHERDAEIHS